jgi:hypothetical protein
MEPTLATPLTGEYNNFLPTGKITRFAGETLYYDIRNSIYEKLVKGKKFIIKTIPERGHEEIFVHILSEHD